MRHRWSGVDGAGIVSTSLRHIVDTYTEVSRARRWSRAWKKAAKRGEVDGEALCVLQNAWAEQGARIAELEDALRSAANTLEKAGWHYCAKLARVVLEGPNE